MNSSKKNNMGFTLIELLAVIVVLAIVMLVAANAVLPRMADARKQVFSIEANAAIQSAQTYYINGNITSNGDVLPVGDAVKCVTIKALREKGFYTGDADYKGYVLVKKVGEVYQYAVTMTNGNLQVSNAGLGDDVTSNEVNDGSAATDTCPAQLTWPGSTG